jgi:hypothetical protein
MTGICRHDLPAGQCALCAPRRPAAGALIVCTTPDGGDVLLHRADCHHAQPRADIANPWPRREVTEAEARAARWPRCLVCQP